MSLLFIKRLKLHMQSPGDVLILLNLSQEQFSWTNLWGAIFFTLPSFNIGHSKSLVINFPELGQHPKYKGEYTWSLKWSPGSVRGSESNKGWLKSWLSNQILKHEPRLPENFQSSSPWSQQDPLLWNSIKIWSTNTEKLFSSLTDRVWQKYLYRLSGYIMFSVC